MQNLNIAFPDKSERELKKITRKFYQNLADLVVENLKSYRITAYSLQKRVDIINPEVLTDFLKKDQSVLAMTGHFGNWEWISLRCGLEINAQLDAIYKPLSNASFDKIMYQIRSRFGAYPVPMKQIVRAIIQRKHLTRVVASVADQRPSGHDKKHWTTFFGQETAFFTGTDKLAQLTQYPVIFVGMKRKKRGFYQIWFEQIAKPPYPEDTFFILEKYAALTQKLIEDNPADWLWSHNRWKYGREA